MNNAVVLFIYYKMEYDSENNVENNNNIIILFK